MTEFGKRGRPDPVPQTTAKTQSAKTAGAPGVALYAVGAGVLALLAFGGMTLFMKPGQPVTRLAGTTDPIKCAAEFRAASQASFSAGPVRIQGQMETDGVAINLTLEAILPRSLHASMEIGGHAMDVIVKEDDAWVNVNGRWVPVPDGSAVTAIRKSLSQVQAMQQQVSGVVRCAGGEIIDGTEYLAYHYSATIDGVAATSVSYVDPVRKLPVRVVGGGSGNGHTMKVDMRTSYDPSIKIERPAL